MPLIAVNVEPTRRQLRQFAAIWFPAFWLLVGWLIWRTTQSQWIVGAIWGAAAAVSVAGWIAPRFMRYVYVIWMWAAYPIGWVVGHLLLAITYFAVLTPIGIVMRLLGRDPMQRRMDRSAPTYWQPHRAIEDVSRYFRQY
jgi:hypothetical protein